MLGFSLAVLAGLMAAMASVLSKLALEEGGKTVQTFMCGVITNESCSMVALLVRVCCFLLVFLCNAVMWSTFTKALNRCSSTIEATATNTSTNFFATAVFGKALFGETLSLEWWMGSLLILFGLLCIHHGARGSVTNGNTKSQDEATDERKNQ